MKNTVKNSIANAIGIRITDLLIKHGSSVGAAGIEGTALARDLANEIEGIIESAAEKIRVRHISWMCDNVSYITRQPNGDISEISASGIPLAFNAGLNHDREGARIALSRITDPQAFVAKLRELSKLGPSGTVQYREGRYELV